MPADLDALEALSRDAERWRWAEEHRADVIHTGPEWVVIHDQGRTKRHKDRNAAIDAAMKGETGA